MSASDRDEMAARMATLIRYCGSRRYIDLHAVARGMGCSERTIRRYLKSLEMAGFKVPAFELHQKDTAFDAPLQEPALSADTTCLRP